MSSTTVSGAEVFTDYGIDHRDRHGDAPPDALHARRAARWSSAPAPCSGPGASTTRTRGISSNTNPSGTPPDKNMQQATVNLFADMGVQPFALLPELGLSVGDQVDRHHGADRDHHLARERRQPPGRRHHDDLRHGQRRRRRGRRGRGLDRRRHARGTRPPAPTSWTYSWAVHGSPTANIKVRATDDSGNVGTPGSGDAVNVGCPCSLWSGTTPRLGGLRRRQLGRGRRQVQVRRLRHRQRHPLLQVVGQHGHARRQPVDHRRARSSPRPRSATSRPPAGSR